MGISHGSQGARGLRGRRLKERVVKLEMVRKIVEASKEWTREMGGGKKTRS